MLRSTIRLLLLLLPLAAAVSCGPASGEIRESNLDLDAVNKQAPPIDESTRKKQLERFNRDTRKRR